MSFLDQTTGTFLKDSIPHLAFAPSPPPKKIIPAQPLGTLAFRQWRQELLEEIQAMEIVIGLSLYQIIFRFKNMQPEYQLWFLKFLLHQFHVICCAQKPLENSCWRSLHVARASYRFSHIFEEPKGWWATNQRWWAG